MDRFQGVRLKLGRAKAHILNLDSIVRGFCDSGPYTISIEERPVIDHVALYLSSVQPIPAELPLILGDAVHNFRSALDHLACQLVEANHGTVTNRTEFPICDSPKKYALAVKHGKIEGMCAGAQALVAARQPYVTQDSTLLHIHDLDRVDKHRLVIAVATMLIDWSIVFGPGRHITFPEDPLPLESGREIVNIPTSTYYGGGHKGFKLGVDIAFGPPEVAAGRPVVETLKGMEYLLDSLVADFERFLV